MPENNSWLSNCSTLCGKNDTNAYFSAWPYVGYATQGVIFGIANLIVFIAILKHPMLRCRKEYAIVAALALADVFHEICMIEGGIQRVQIATNGQESLCKYPFDCIMTIHGFLWNITIPLVYFMLLCISIDRFTFVLRPLTYKTLSINYSILLAGLFYMIAFLEAGFRILGSYLDTKQLKKHSCPEIEGLCLLDHAFSDTTFYLSASSQLCSSVISVILYGCIPFIYKRQVKRLTQLGQLGKAELIFLQEQKKLLVTLGISSIFTFFLMAFPAILRLALYQIKNVEAFPWAALIMNFNPIVNTFLFTFRHRKFRQSFISVLKCRAVKVDGIGYKSSMDTCHSMSVLNVE